MSKKNKKSRSLKLEKKIKSIMIELRELRSEVKKLKLSPGPRRQSKKSKALASEPTLKIATPVPAKVEISPAVSGEKESIAARVVGRS
jgi:hypothetical protein